MLLDFTRLPHLLHDAPVGHTMDYHLSIPSTMPRAHQLAEQPGSRSGTLVVAEEQTSGRGRFERRWEAPTGQALLLSVILKPPLAFDVTETPVRSGLAVIHALEQAYPALERHVGLKWPNDVLLGNGLADGRKVAGILVENCWRGEQLAHTVVGIGLNVNQPADQLPGAPAGAPQSVSVRLFLGSSEDLDRTGLLAMLCRALGQQLLCAGESAVSQPEWQQRMWSLGQRVNVFEADKLVWHGKAVAVQGDGSLVVVNAKGESRRFVAGEVTLRVG
jgi:BirA family biotin operon repressor/biotin-[acetyl-CoA-carboxylase] ligase